jgi:hypothetical protein
MEPWQVFLLVFMIALPMALAMPLTRSGDDKLTFRGRPTEREWRRQIEHDPDADQH